MDCKQVQEKLTALALGELDVELRRQVQGHLAGCAVCRGARANLDSAVASLRSLPALESSESRRERALEGMNQEHRVRVEQAFLYRSGVPARMVGVAAAVLVLMAAGIMAYNFLNRERETFYLQAVRVEGRVSVSGDMWRQVREGDIIRPNERVRTEEGAVIQFMVMTDQGKAGEMFVNQKSSVAVGRRAVGIDEGEIYANTTLPMVVSTPTNDRFVVNGPTSFEAGLRETLSLDLSDYYRMKADKTGASVVFERNAPEEIARAIGQKLNVRIDVDPAARPMRVAFYGRWDDPNLLDALSRALEMQDLALLPVSDDRYRINAKVREGRERRLFARVTTGKGTLWTSKGSLEIAENTEGIVVPEGIPRHLVSEQSVVAWKEPGYYAQLAKNRVQVAPVELTPGRSGGKPSVVVQARQQGIVVDVGGQPMMLEFEGLEKHELTGEGEATLPIKIRLKRIN